jgi:hypothetical protein
MSHVEQLGKELDEARQQLKTCEGQLTGLVHDLKMGMP